MCRTLNTFTLHIVFSSFHVFSIVIIEYITSHHCTCWISQGAYNWGLWASLFYLMYTTTLQSQPQRKNKTGPRANQSVDVSRPVNETPPKKKKRRRLSAMNNVLKSIFVPVARVKNLNGTRQSVGTESRSVLLCSIPSRNDKREHKLVFEQQHVAHRCDI